MILIEDSDTNTSPGDEEKATTSKKSTGKRKRAKRKKRQAENSDEEDSEGTDQERYMQSLLDYLLTRAHNMDTTGCMRNVLNWPGKQSEERGRLSSSEERSWMRQSEMGISAASARTHSSVLAAMLFPSILGNESRYS